MGVWLCKLYYCYFMNEENLFYILNLKCAFNTVARETVVSSVRPYLDHEEIVARREKQDGSRPKEFPPESAVTRPLRSCPSALHSITHSSDWMTEETHYVLLLSCRTSCSPRMHLDDKQHCSSLHFLNACFFPFDSATPRETPNLPEFCSQKLPDSFKQQDLWPQQCGTFADVHSLEFHEITD